MANNTTARKSASATADKAAPESNVIESMAAATDEFAAVQVLAQAGWPGRSASEVLDAARKVANAKGRMAQNAADNDLAKAAAKAAGATGLAQHDRTRVAGLFNESGEIAKAAAEAAPTRDGAARALVWYIAALNAAEDEVAS